MSFNPQYLATPTTLGEGQRTTGSVDASGALRVTSTGAGAAATTIQGAAADDAAVAGNPVLVAGKYESTLNTQENGDVSTLKTDANGRLLVTRTGLTPVVTSVAASSKVLSAAACNLHGVNVTSGAVAGYALIYNLSAAPIDGTVTPVKTYALAANSSLEVGFDPPLLMSTGAVVAFSSTGPFTQTLSATAFIGGEVS